MSATAEKFRKSVPWLIGLIALLSLVVRMQDLSVRPMHADEAVQSMKFAQLLEDGLYEYDPVEHHGPTLYYGALPFAWLSAAENASDLTAGRMRLLPVLASIFTILLLILIRDLIGDIGALVAAVLLAVSPANAFYARYYIQETQLVLFAVLLIVSGWRYFRAPGKGWAIVFGLAIGLLFTTKESWIIPVAALSAGAVAAWLLSGKPMSWLRRDLFWAAGAALALSLVLFSSFFTHWGGVADSIRTYGNYLDKSQSLTGHEKPALYYLELLIGQRARGVWWTEIWILILALAGLLAYPLIRKPQRAGWAFLAVATILTLTVYSLLAYKTPWIVLGPLSMMILLAGFTVNTVWERCPNTGWRILTLVIPAAMAIHLASVQNVALFRYHSVSENPYAYSHTVSDVGKLENMMVDLAAVHAEGQELRVDVVGHEQWPLPWYLRHYPNTGYWETEPGADKADVVIVTLPDEASWKPQDALPGYMDAYYGIRDGVTASVFIEGDLWRKMVEARSK